MVALRRRKIKKKKAQEITADNEGAGLASGGIF